VSGKKDVLRKNQERKGGSLKFKEAEFWPQSKEVRIGKGERTCGRPAEGSKAGKRKSLTLRGRMLVRGEGDGLGPTKGLVRSRGTGKAPLKKKGAWDGGRGKPAWKVV